jgi:hypothetical protein
MQVIRLFNEPEGQCYLAKMGVPEALIAQLSLLGISGVANLLSAIKMARWYEWGEGDVVMTVLTDSMDLYASRLEELRSERGPFTAEDAAIAYHQHLVGQRTDNMEELSYPARKRVHNLKYYTWVEQQGKTYDEIQAQWFDRAYWSNIHNQVDEIEAVRPLTEPDHPRRTCHSAFTVDVRASQSDDQHREGNERHCIARQ